MSASEEGLNSQELSTTENGSLAETARPLRLSPKQNNVGALAGGLGRFDRTC